MEINLKKSKLCKEDLNFSNKNQKVKKNSNLNQDETISIKDESYDLTTENLIHRETQNPTASYNINTMNFGNNYNNYNNFNPNNFNNFCYPFPGLTEDLFSQNDITGQLYNFTNIQNLNASNLNMSIGSNFLGGFGYPYGPAISPLENQAFNNNLYNIYEVYGLNSKNLQERGNNSTSQTINSMKPGPKIPIRTINNDDYIYVNPKQYLRILQRREKRRRLNLSRLGKGSENPSMRPKYIHESRHKHAMTRERGKGGRFVSKKEESVKSKSDST